MATGYLSGKEQQCLRDCASSLGNDRRVIVELGNGVLPHILDGTPHAVFVVSEKASTDADFRNGCIDLLFVDVSPGMTQTAFSNFSTYLALGAIVVFRRRGRNQRIASVIKRLEKGSILKAILSTGELWVGKENVQLDAMIRNFEAEIANV